MTHKIFRTRRQARYELLRKCGFLRIEASDLSKVPLRIPYMDKLIKQRYEDYKQAFRDKWTQAKWDSEIKKKYREKNWITDKRSIYDSWAMLRNFEHAYRNQHPEYESPWEKRRRSMKDFIQQVDQTVVRLPGKKPLDEATRQRLLDQQEAIDEQFKYIREQREKR